MSALGFQINADDAHLAFVTLSDEMEESLDKTLDTEHWNRTYSAMTDRVRNQLLPIIRLGGLTRLEGGDCDYGNEEIARKIINESIEYQCDPEGYHNSRQLNSLVTAPGTGTPSPSPEDAAASIAQAVNPVQTPEVVHAPPVARPLEVALPPAEITIYDLPAGSRFNGILADYQSLLIPMINWVSPKPFIKPHNPNFAFTGYALKIMVSAIRRRKNVLAFGPPGCGKTEFFKQYGAITGLPVHKIPFDGSLSRSEIIGSFRQVVTANGPETPFVLGKIPQLIQQPGIIILDEIDQADPDIQYMLHSVYEGEGLMIQEDGGRYIPRHEHCYIVATANTQGRGSEDGLTNARYEMSEATRDRFPYWIEFDYLDEPVEIKTLSDTTGLSVAHSRIVCQIGNSIRSAYKAGALSQTCSLRQLEYVAELVEDFTDREIEVAIALACNTVIVGRANKDDAAAIREYIKTSTGCDLNTIEF